MTIEAVAALTGAAIGALPLLIARAVTEVLVVFAFMTFSAATVASVVWLAGR